MLSRTQLNVATLASQKGGRYTLSGILVTPEETVETDGHQLVRVGATAIDPESFPPVPGCTPTKDFQPFLLPKDAALAIAKALPKKTTIPVLDYAAVGAESDADGFAVLSVTDLENPQVFRPRKMEGQFPDWHRCMPKKEDAKVEVQFNAALLVRVLSFITRSSEDKERTDVSFRFYENGGAVRIDAHGADIQAVVMPLKDSDKDIEPLPEPAAYFEADTPTHIQVLRMIAGVVTTLAAQFTKPASRGILDKAAAYLTGLADKATVAQKESVQ